MTKWKGRIVPVKPLVVIYWGDLDEKTNVVRPIPLWKVRAVPKPPPKDDDGDGIPEVNSPEEVKASLKTMTAVCLINIALNLLLVFQTSLGYRGIAVATVRSSHVEHRTR
jgi:hypothetical protein